MFSDAPKGFGGSRIGGWIGNREVMVTGMATDDPRLRPPGNGETPRSLCASRPG